MIGLSHYLILSGILFAIGIVGVTTSRNVIKILLSLELLLNAANLSFVAFSRYNGDYTGQLVVFFVMLVAAAEVAIGLAIVVLMYRQAHTVQADDLKELRW
jgi:NADH-quinone oxidoreductase subunit K